MNAELHSLTRSGLIAEITRRAIRNSSLNLLKFASDVAERYQATVPTHARIVDFYVEQGSIESIARSQRANGQLINRFLTGVTKFPADLEESWVASLPAEYRDEAVRELAARYGLAAARKPGDVRQTQSDLAKMMHKFADVVDDLGKILADGKIDAADRPVVAKAERDIDALMGELMTLRAAARSALGRKRK